MRVDVLSKEYPPEIYGGAGVHVAELVRALRARDDLTTRVHAFGGDYAETLHRWRQTFLQEWPAIHAQGFDETFRRMWEFYLAYCEAGFATHYLDVAQIRLARRTAQ